MKIYAPSRISRRLGERFFFKAERDASQKSAMTRRPYPPGVHGKKRRRGQSEFGTELAEKQKVRFSYGITDSMLKKYVGAASGVKGKTKTQALLELLERRLDNAVYRMGIAPSRRIARHLASYGHLYLNGKGVKNPSLQVRPGDKITIREKSRKMPVFENLTTRLKKYQAPEWVMVSDDAVGEVKRLPKEEDNLTQYNLNKVIEYYSR